MPELEPVPRDHVLTKTFYLLDRIVGRTEIGQTWIEALPPPDPNDRAPRPARAGDSVSPIIIASDDLAAAWAERRRPAAALSAHSRRRAPARTGPPQRRQSGDVHADRQLQGRSGARQGHSRKAHPLSVWSIAFSPLVPPSALYVFAARGGRHLGRSALAPRARRVVAGAGLRAASPRPVRPESRAGEPPAA